MNRYTLNITYENESKKIVISKYDTVDLLIGECLEKFGIIGEERAFDYQLKKKNDKMLDKMVQLRFSGVTNNMSLWLEFRKRSNKREMKVRKIAVKVQIVEAGSDSVTCVDNVDMNKSLKEVIEHMDEKHSMGVGKRQEDKEMMMDVFGAVYDDEAMKRVKLSDVAGQTGSATLRLIFEKRVIAEEKADEVIADTNKETNVKARVHGPGDAGGITDTTECLSDDYEVTVESAKLYLKSIKNKLKKRSDHETPVFKNFLVRIRFPCGNILAVEFVDPSKVKLKDLFEKIDLFLLEKFISNYSLKLSYPPFSKINTSPESMEKDIVSFPEFKSNCVLLIWELLSNDGSVDFLKEEHRVAPKIQSNDANDTKKSDKTEDKKTGKSSKHKNKKNISKKMPKWFKMQSTR